MMESLEEYLSGTLEPAVLRDIEAHLTTCSTCREEIHSMRDVSQLFVSLRSDEVLIPAPGFYARVLQQVGRQRPAPTFAGWFGLDMAFGRRLVFASLLMMAVLGSYLVTRESGYPAGPSPEAILAQQNAPAFETARAEDNMLVTLTAYEH
jgi:predicted anti-sigma-YlaC factor YlaD